MNPKSKRDGRGGKSSESFSLPPPFLSPLNNLNPRFLSMIRKDNPSCSLSLPPSSTPPALPGLVSSLRPIKRSLPQLVDEQSLLRRFTYKNKNQFKGTGWWRKIIEADRCTARAVDELSGWVDEWGFK